MISNRSKPFYEGAAAYTGTADAEDDDSRAAATRLCPYADGSAHARDWHEGFLAAGELADAEEFFDPSNVTLDQAYEFSRTGLFARDADGEEGDTPGQG
jgi:hypothetical protein